MAYTPEEKEEIFNRIFEGIAEDGESLRSVLMRHDMPSRTTFFEWIDADQDKANQYARACEIRADKIFDEILDIADENNADISIGDDGQVRMNGDVVQRSRLKIDARKWALSKMNPKKYGDKVDLNHTLGGEVDIKPAQWVSKPEQ